jgi:hypothetical protein
MAKGIRSYGPGKFYTILDGYAYEIGFDEEESYPEGGGSYGLLRLDDSAREAISKAAADNEDQLTKEEEDQLDDSKAIIFFERSDGIVEAEWFSDLEEAEAEWEAIQEEMEGDE